MSKRKRKHDCPMCLGTGQYFPGVRVCKNTLNVADKDEEEAKGRTTIILYSMGYVVLFTIIFIAVIVGFTL